MAAAGLILEFCDVPLWAQRCHPPRCIEPAKLAVSLTTPGTPEAAIAGGRPALGMKRPPTDFSDLCLLRNLERVVHLDAKVPDSRLQLGVPEQQLDGTQVLGPPINQRRLRPSH